MPAGGVDYYFMCAFEGFLSVPTYYPDTAPYAFQTYTNSLVGPGYRCLDFDSWSSITLVGTYTNSDGWVVKNGLMYGSSGYTPASAPRAGWLNYLSNTNQGTYEGKILVGGAFTNLAGQARNYIGRMNINGGLDGTFTNGATSNVFALAVQPDGKIIVGGDFTNLAGEARNHIGRFNRDGSLDTSFTNGTDNTVRSIALQADGKVLVGGSFTSLAGQARNHIGRLNVDGSLDTSFGNGADSTVQSIAVQTDGKIIVGGDFTNLAGQARSHIGRLNENGSLDASFGNVADNTVQSIVVQPDGKILLGGAFTNLAEEARKYLGRLNADGSLDMSFTNGTGNTVCCLALQADGKILVGGAFTNFLYTDSLTNLLRNCIGRLNVDGSLDSSFTNGTDNTVQSIAVQINGKILVGGEFTNLAGQARNYIGRLNSDGSIDSTLASGADNKVYSIVQAGCSPWILSPLMSNGVGSVCIASRSRMPGMNTFSVEYSTNGSDWVTNCVLTNANSALWVTNAVFINTVTSSFVRIQKLYDTGVASLYLGLDNIAVSYPPADVQLTNICHSPVYPCFDQDITFTVRASSTNVNFPAFNISPKLCYSNAVEGSTWQTNSMAYTGSNNEYSATIQPSPVGDLLYYIRCDFDGYYYTNGGFSDRASPAYWPDASSSAAMPDEPQCVKIRHFVSQYDYLAATGTMGTVVMSLTGNNDWQGHFKYNRSTNRITLNFSGYGLDSGGGHQAVVTNSWGDSYQTGYGLPQSANAQMDGSNIVINLDTNVNVSVILRFNTDTRAYCILRGAYQDFNRWQASADYFEESIDAIGIGTLTNSFNDWATNSTYRSIANIDLGDFQSWLTGTYVGVSAPWFPDDTPGQNIPYYQANYYISNLYYIGKAMIIQESDGTNLACILSDKENNGQVKPWRETLTEGLGTLSFRYRAMEDTNYNSFTYYSPPSSWNNYVIEGDILVPNAGPGNLTGVPAKTPYIAMIAKLQDPNLYYECRLLQREGASCQLTLWKKNFGSWTMLNYGALFSAYITDPLFLRFYAVTNTSGSIYLEASVPDIDPYGAFTCYYIDTTEPVFRGDGNVGLDVRDADLSVENIKIRHANVQRLLSWTGPVNTFGTYTNNGWVIENGKVEGNPLYVVLDKILTNFPCTYSVQNFEGWAPPAWAASSSNGGWEITSGNISTNFAYSPTNAACLRNDGYSNSAVRTRPMTNGISTMSFSCRNYGTNSIQFAVQTAATPDGPGWQTVTNIVNTNNFFEYGHKMKVTFAGYNKNETLRDFPALVALSTNITGFRYTDFTSTNGCDLRFADATESRELHYEVDSWDTSIELLPTNIPGCCMWLKADDGVVTNGTSVTDWQDRSGTGNDVTWANDKPTYISSWRNGKPAVYFNGNDYMVRNKTISFPSTNWHVFIVQRTIQVRDSFVFKVNSTYPGRVSNHIPWSDSKVYWDCGGASGEARLGNGIGGLTTTGYSMWEFVSYDSYPNTQELWQDGILRASDNTALTIINASGVTFSLGMGDSAYMNSELAELIIYKSRLTDEQKNQVGYYLAKKYNLGTTYRQPGVSYAWVKVPAIVDTNSFIWACWGGAYTNLAVYCTNGATWSSDYEAVWHMQNSDSGDSSVNNYATKSLGTIPKYGMIGKGQEFDGASDYIDVTNGFSSFQGITVSVWAYPTLNANWARVIDFGNGPNANNILMAREGTSDHLQFQCLSWGGVNNLDSPGQWANNTWQHLVATITPGALGTLYKNGQQVGQWTSRTVPSGVLRRNNYIGKSNWPDALYKGRMDELTIATVARSSNWVWATYMNTASNSAFCNYSAVQDVGSASVGGWNSYNVTINTDSLVYARIYLPTNQPLNPGTMLGIDDVRVEASEELIPKVVIPDLPYRPGKLKFEFYPWGAGGAGIFTQSTVRVRGSTDGAVWTTIAGPFTGWQGSWYQYETPDAGGVDLSSFRYIAIENLSTNAQLPVRNFYLEEATNFYYQTFATNADGWTGPNSSWYVTNHTYNKPGYAGPSLQLLVQTNYAPTAENPGPPEPWGTFTTIPVSNLNYQTANVPIRFWDDLWIRLKHGSGQGNIVIDDVSMSSWQGTNYVASNGWISVMGWISSTNPADAYVEYWKSMVAPGSNQYLRTPLMTNGVGVLTFNYKVASPPVSFDIRTLTNGQPDPTNICTVVCSNTSWDSYSLAIKSDVTQYVYIVHSSTNNSAVLYLDNVEASDYVKRDDTMWFAYNALVTFKDFAPVYEPTYQPPYAVKSCFLNNHNTDGCRVPLSYTNTLPFLQTPFMSNGIGEISFRYRAWDTTATTNAATIYIMSTTNELTPATNWSTIGVISSISNTDYRLFVTNTYITTNFVLRILCQTNSPTARFAIDNVCITEPISANVDIDNIGTIPTVPLYTNTVNVSVDLRNFVLRPSNIVVRAYYAVGTNDWGNVPTNSNYITLDQMIATNEYGYTLKSSSGAFATQPVDTVVQYIIWCSFDGLLASNASPKITRKFVNPPWYHPVDLNKDKFLTTPYYYVFSCPTGSAWINEINITDENGDLAKQFVELCGRSGSILSNWWLESMKPDFTTTAVYRITNNAVLLNETNWYGFWLLSSNDVTGADATLTNHLPFEGGIRLRRSMGAIEHGVSWGEPNAANGGRSMTNYPAERFVYAGYDEGMSYPPFYSLALTGSGSNCADFAWNYTDNQSPGGANYTQDFTYNAPPVADVILTISNFWITTSNVVIRFVSTSTNNVMPKVYYSTNLASTGWTQVPETNYTFDPVTGVYTQWFNLQTNYRAYFYKVVGTNSP